MPLAVANMLISETKAMFCKCVYINCRWIVTDAAVFVRNNLCISKQMSPSSQTLYNKAVKEAYQDITTAFLDAVYYVH